MNKICLTILLFTLSVNTYGQYYDTGQDPASTRWRSIQTNNFNIVFQEGYDRHAIRLANSLEYARTTVPNSLGVTPRPTNVLLHNQTVVPNAFALLTPFRVEINTCPAQNSYAHDWMQQMAVHEYRHMNQYYALEQGVTKPLYYLTGHHSSTIMLSLFFPSWLMEGDAICMETAMSHSGRGRLPSFEMKTRAQVLEKGIFNFNKASLGSYRDYVPDIYYLGYNIVSYARKLYGTDLLKTALDNITHRPYTLAPLSRAFHEYSGLSREAFYQAAYDSLRMKWQKQADHTRLTPMTRWSKPTNGRYVNYRLGRYLLDTLVLAEKSGRDSYPKIISLDPSGKEHKICIPGYFTSELIFPRVSAGNALPAKQNSPGSFTMDNLTFSHDRIAWAGMMVDPRWKHRSYSVIKVHDLTKGKTQLLTSKTRYFSPDFFPQGDRLAVAEVTEMGENWLTIIDSYTGEELKKYQTPDKALFTYPSVSLDGQSVYSVVIGEKGKSLVEVRMANGSVNTILPYSYQEISRPVDHPTYLFFSAAYSGIDNIYALHKETGAIYQVTSSAYGAGDPDFNSDGTRMIYSDYTADGYALVETRIDPATWTPLEKVEDHSPQIWKDYVDQELGMMEDVNIPDSQYVVGNYKKAHHLLNFHSWAPISFNLQTFSLKPGVSVMSQNLLSTTFITAGYEFEKRISDGRFHVDLSYRGLYPVLDVSASHGVRLLSNDGDSLLRFRESGLMAGLHIPLTFLYHHYAFKVVPQAQYNFILQEQLADEGLPSDPVNNQFIKSSLLLAGQSKKAELNLRPTWSQELELHYNRELNVSGQPGYLASASLTLLTPGVGRHHSLRLYAGYQEKRTTQYDFDEPIAYPRGYYYQTNRKLTSLSASYLFPLLNPDLALGPIVYIKQIRANLFGDLARGLAQNGQTRDYQSFGMELTGEFYFIQSTLPFEIGVRQAWLPVEKSWHTRLLLSINLSKL